MKSQSVPFAFLLVALLIGSTPVFAELSERAPDALPGTTPEMRNPGYWIARMKDPDGIILTPEQIRRMNEEFRKKMRTFDPMRDVPEDRRSPLRHYFPGIVLAAPDLRSVSQEAVSDTVRVRIRSEIDYLRSREWGNPGGIKYAPWEINRLEKEMALDRVGRATAIRDGIAVRTTRLKNVPAFFPDKLGLLTNGRVRWDLWDIGVLKIGKPVMVLHPSLSGEFVLVLCEIGFGWVRSDDIAFGDRETIDGFVDADDFILCTGDRVQFYSDESCTYASGFFRMGDRLPVASRGNLRTVLAPVRKMDGSFATETTWLAKDADVHRGLLPYTRRNIVVTAFKLLDNQYDFTGTYFGRQHETTYRDIFACFGFVLPYHGGLFTHYGHDETVLHPEERLDEQYRVILSHEPFVTIQATLQDQGGHCQLLLGDYNGVPIVFDQHGYSYRDENGTELVVRRCCIGTVLIPEYFLKRKVTFLELK